MIKDWKIQLRIYLLAIGVELLLSELQDVLLLSVYHRE